MIANTALYSPEPGSDGSTRRGCISETARVAPIGRAEVGAMVSGLR